MSIRRAGDQGRFGPELYRVVRLVGIPDECWEDLTPRVEAYDSRERVPEEPFSTSQERALTLDASPLPEQSQRDVLRVREPLYGLVASGAPGATECSVTTTLAAVGCLPSFRAD